MDLTSFELNKILGYLKFYKDPRARNFHWPLDSDELKVFYYYIITKQDYRNILEHADEYYKRKMRTLKSNKCRYHWSNTMMVECMAKHFLPMTKKQASFWLTGTHSRATHYREEQAENFVPDRPVLVPAEVSDVEACDSEADG